MMYGGARGGGKSDFLIGDFMQDVHQGPAWRGLLLRRSFPELDEITARSQQIIPATWPGAEWLKGDRTWILPSGATLRLRSLEQPEDVTKFMGHQYAWLGWDEVAAFPTDAAYKMMFGCLRSAAPVDCMRVRCTANPGGAGHSWLKMRFVDPAPHGYELIEDVETGMERVYIPAKVTDNKILLANDPHYIDRLKGVGSPELVRSWLAGDWSAIVGSYFPEFGEQHIRRPFAIPKHWLRFRSFDWGSARPFAVLWLAMSDGDVPGVPRGALVVYRELYGASAPNVGLRLTAEQVADLIREYESGDEPVAYSVADPSIFAHDGGPSIGERMAERGVRFRPADNTRVGRLGAFGGWDLVRQRLVGEDDRPMIYFFSTCVDLIRSLPTLQHDSRRPEDLDTTGDDHIADAIRYAVLSRAWIKAAEPGRPAGVTLNMLWEQRERERRVWH
jgi:hypothetical protein